MAIFHVIRTQTGPAWDGAKRMEEQTLWAEHADYMDTLAERGFFLFGGPIENRRVVFAVEAESEDALRDELARDPWHETHLVIESIEPWTIRIGAERLR